MPDLLDAYKGDSLLAPAFMSLVVWAAQQDEIVAEFEAETGHRRPPAARTPLDIMIDDATGVVDDYAMAFARWVHDTMWAEPADEAEESDA